MRPVRSLNRKTLPVAALAVLATTLILLLNTLSGSATAGGNDARSGPSVVVTPAHSGSSPKPTIVLVHGAFADASSWSGEIRLLQRRGYPVIAPANPLRSLAGDAESLRVLLGTIPGPIVLVGHSYGGAVITNAATGNPNVKALVYIAAYAPDLGETVAEAGTLGGGTSTLPQNLVVRPFPGAGPGDGDASINPSAFRAVFAQDVSATRAAVMAASQRPVTLSALGTPSGAPAWKTIPSWALVAAEDRAIPAQAERAMAKRAHARTVEIHSSHAALVAHPGAVTRLILAAACS